MAGLTFVAKRFAFAAVLLVVVSILVFSLLSLAGGSPVSIILGGSEPAEGQVEAIRAEYHLDEPFYVRYGYWLVDALQLDLGRSISSSQSVASLIVERLPVTLTLAVMCVVLIVGAGVPLGMMAGARRGTWIDRMVSSTTTLALSAPPFAVGIVLIYVFGVKLNWFPVYGSGSNGLGDRLWHLVLPSCALAVSLVAIVARQTRAATLRVMEQDFITFARARGLSRSRILVRYALRNTALPVITVTGLLLISLVGGTVLIEQVFSIDGIGQLMIRSVRASDVPVVQGITLLIAVFVVVINLIVDLLGMVLDPRTRYATKG